MSKQHLFAALAIAFAQSSFAAPPAAHVEVHDAWARATLPGQMAGAAFMTITTDKSAAVTAVATPVAAMAQVHQMVMQGSVMSMRPLPALAIEPGVPTVLNATGSHVMLMDLKRPLVQGERIPMTLTVTVPGQGAQSVPVMVEIRSATAQ